MDNQRVVSWFPERLRDFSLIQSIQKESGVHTAAHLTITCGLYPSRRTDQRLQYFPFVSNYLIYYFSPVLGFFSLLGGWLDINGISSINVEVKNVCHYTSNTCLHGVHRNSIILFFFTLLPTTYSHVVGCAIIIIITNNDDVVVVVIGS